ncbi:response regulator [bacterium]|nr:response regulator [bacterium]
MDGLKVLIIDDDTRVLGVCEDALSQHFEVEVAEGPRAGLTKILKGENYAVVVADLMMSGISGLEILRRLKEWSPLTVGILFSGHSDSELALRAINGGEAYRYIRKPCTEQQLVGGVQAGLDYHHLLSCQQAFLRDTLAPVLQLVGTQLASMQKELYGRTFPMGRFVRLLAEALELTEAWEFEVAATLAALGWCTAPKDVQRKLHGRVPGDSTVALTLGFHESRLHESLARIGRMHDYLEMLRQPNRAWQLILPGDHPLTASRLQIGGHLLHFARQLAELTLRNNCSETALRSLKARRDFYHPKMLEAAEGILVSEGLKRG